jgi:adenylate cyclase
MDLLVNTETLEFDGFRLDFKDQTLFRIEEHGGAVPIALGARAFDLLSVLVSHPGVVVSKSAIMDAVWPGLAVEESNLTVQMSALRRVLDQSRTDGSCIQTVSGRGYRFLPEVKRLVLPFETGLPPAPDDAIPASPKEHVVQPAPPLRSSRWRFLRTGAVAMAAVSFVIFVMFMVRELQTQAMPPRLSIAVLPFANVDRGSDQDLTRLADGVTEDLTTDLAQLSDAPVTPRQSALRFRDQPINALMVGRELNVRYVLTGSLRPVGAGVRANAALISGETGVTLWVDQLDVGATDGTIDQDEIVGWLRNSVIRQLMRIEATRGVRERPDHPDALDLILQARVAMSEPPSTKRGEKAQGLYEQALRLDPTALPAMTGLAHAIIGDTARLGLDLAGIKLDRARELTAAAAAIAPSDASVLSVRAYLLRVQERWAEAEVAYERVLTVYPHDDAAVHMLGVCKLQLGRSDAAIPFLQKRIRDDPHNPDIWASYLRLGEALLLTGRYDEAVDWIQRSLGADPEQSPGARSFAHALMASAYALGGRVARAQEEIVEVNSLGPYRAVRSFMAWNVANQAFTAQIEKVREGLRLAGLRDHVDEDEDFGIAPDSRPRIDLVGYTPRTVPGATVIRTPELVGFIHDVKPVIIDANQGNRTLVGAVNLFEAGLGGSLPDPIQDRLRSMMATLTGGDLSRPIVAVGENSERWTGYNLSLRLVALGYRNVLWYRGGREAWEVAGLPLALAQPMALPSR